MRRYALAFTAGVALLATLGLSAPALAKNDPHCDQYGDEVGVFEFTIDTPDTHNEHRSSGVIGSGYACGSDLTLSGGDETLYNHADIGVPPGVEIADSDTVPTGSRAGYATVNILYRLGVPLFSEGVPSDVVTDDKAECERERSEEVVGPVPAGEIVACYKGWNFLGHNWSWAARDEDGRYALTIGPMHALGGIEPGLTYIKLELCRFFGPVSGEQCGTGGQWMQKNGDASKANDPFASCANGNGRYMVTATMENGTTTPEASTCVEWITPFNRRNVDLPNVDHRKFDPPNVDPNRLRRHIDPPNVDPNRIRRHIDPPAIDPNRVRRHIDRRPIDQP